MECDGARQKGPRDRTHPAAAWVGARGVTPFPGAALQLATHPSLGPMTPFAREHADPFCTLRLVDPLVEENSSYPGVDFRCFFPAGTSGPQVRAPGDIIILLRVKVGATRQRDGSGGDMRWGRFRSPPSSLLPLPVSSPPSPSPLLLSALLFPSPLPLSSSSPSSSPLLFPSPLPRGQQDLPALVATQPSPLPSPRRAGRDLQRTPEPERQGWRRPCHGALRHVRLRAHLRQNRGAFVVEACETPKVGPPG